MPRINPDHVEWCTWGDDNNGRIFRYEGTYYRGIRPRSTPLYQRLLNEGILEDLASRGLLVATKASNLELAGYAMVLEHETIPFISYPHEWCFSMLRDAGKCTLELNRTLLRHGLTTADGHSHNVLFRTTHPVFVDVGSIVECSPGAPLRSYQEFQSFFVRPLKLQQRRGMDRIITNLLRDERRGISNEEYRLLSGSRIPRIRPKLVSRPLDVDAMNERVQRKLILSRNSVLRRAGRILCRLPGLRSSAPAEVAIEQLDRQLDAISIPRRTSQWADYYAADLPDNINLESLDRRETQICEAIETARPKSVIDLAGNQGRFSILARQLGVQKVLCLDYDLAAVEKMYLASRDRNLDILPLQLDVMHPCGGSTTLAAPERSVHRRLTCDMALALALTHHLSLTQRIPFPSIAATLATYTRRHLLVEFMPYGLGIGKPSLNLPEWYTLEGFKCALGQHFSKIDVFETDIECNNRILLVCEK